MRQQLFLPVILVILLAAVSILATAGAAPGMTKKEVHRRHIDMVNNNLLQMQDDIDAVLLIDRPSRLSDMVVR